MAQRSLKCKRCNKKFVTESSTRVYCSVSCRKNSWKDRNRERVREDNREYFKRRWQGMTGAEREAYRDKYSRKPKEKFPCAFCGKTIVGFRSKKKCCSQECNKKLWRKNNPKRSSFHTLQRKKKIKERSDGSFTFEVWQEMRKQCDYTCLVCGLREPEIKLTIDHIKPLDKGGLHTVSNIQPLCVVCNCRKNNRYREDEGWRSEWCVIPNGNTLAGGENPARQS